MRIISQNGRVDFPYENFSLSITKDNCIVSTRDTIASISEISISVIAEYSTEEKARKAMEMLQKAYSPLLIIKDLGDGIEADIKPNDWKTNRTEPTGIRENYYFRFPADDEIEV